MIRPIAACCNLLLVAACLAAGPEAGGPDEWLAGLAADEFQQRERAAERLAEWAGGHPVEARERFFAASVDHDDPEVRMRCRELLRGVVLAEYRRDGQGYVGINMGRVDEVNPDDGGRTFGVRVMQVMPDTPAAEAGLQAGDVIFAIDGKRWDQPGASDHFQGEIMARRPGETVRLGIRRVGEPQPVEKQVKLARRPPIAEAAQLLLLPGQQFDPAALQRAEEDRFFKQWYDRRLAEHRAARQ